MKILILTGSYGNGHLKVSKTLKEAFIKNGCNEIVESDLYLDAHPLLTKASKYLFLKAFTRGQRIYGKLYYAANKDKKFLKKADFMNNFGMKTLKSLVNIEKPDIIVNTFPMLVVPEFRKKSGAQIPIVNVITDYVLHKNWIHTEVDKYYVASEDLKRKLVDKGIPIKKVFVTGIPVESSFEEEADKTMIFQSFGLDKDKPVTLISAGAYGVMKDLGDVLNRLLTIQNHQVVVVCGKNSKLKAEITTQFGTNPNVRILGFTNRMSDLMKIASVMVTKPGGITLSEALSVQVPLVLYGGVPGQEIGNALFFEKNGAAVVVNHCNELVENIEKLIHNDYLRKSIQHNMKAMYHAYSAEVICKDVMTTVEKLRMKQEVI